MSWTDEDDDDDDDYNKWIFAESISQRVALRHHVSLQIDYFQIAKVQNKAISGLMYVFCIYICNVVTKGFT